ncbi:MAG: hypothetical protein UW64_C0002G0046 [Microgenomates group bacterium GW2011_GWC1_44_37]|nr:MAG: hypothetical protein UW64_C0002G0046 [Microgenomates group bacterium GW2011_GWC1_44_37]
MDVEDIPYEKMIDEVRLGRLNKQLGWLADGKTNFEDFKGSLEAFGIPYSERQLRILLEKLGGKTWDQAKVS